MFKYLNIYKIVIKYKMDKTKPKILGNLDEETHKEVVKLKADLGHKNVNVTLKFLLDVYKNKIEQDNLNIENSNNQEKESEGDI